MELGWYSGQGTNDVLFGECNSIPNPSNICPFALLYITQFHGAAYEEAAPA
jgi:hypothetical protein